MEKEQTANKVVEREKDENEEQRAHPILNAALIQRRIFENQANAKRREKSCHYVHVNKKRMTIHAPDVSTTQPTTLLRERSCIFVSRIDNFCFI